MRHATWQRLEASPFWLELYRHYRRLPAPLRVPLRMLALLQWYLTALGVRLAARNRVQRWLFLSSKRTCSAGGSPPAY
jgi:hypothetical protein